MTFRQFHDIMIDLSLVEAIDGVCHSRVVHEQLIDPSIKEVTIIDNEKWSLRFSKRTGKVSFQTKELSREQSEQIIHDKEVISIHRRQLELVLVRYLKLVENSPHV